MTDYAVTGIYAPKGIGDGNINFVKHVVATALANLDTVTMTVPDGVPKDSYPINMKVFSSATPALPDADLGVTSHNRTTGVTVLTATAAVAAGSVIIVEYASV